ncbi:Dimethylaniline monooxygenase [N-oxide-forming] 2 [Araneus ventricosus]|uniref:Flavin-containing monooxygenase n=1 Tax=Araneus ventricosus TaxID=182803 RepID=A0A4Y2KTJ7_ARAVE|nr:Dimethylaniline monooxygenase [N-oxide-forming] 2 [Araneus ventricosus]
MCAVWTLKEEGGFEPICFEKTDQPGGTWCYREEAIDGVPSIMPSTIINHSKEMGALSNIPPPKESNNFMKHNEIYQYFMDAARSRDVLRHIRFNTEVIEVKRTSYYEDTGRWSVTVKDTISGERSTDVYDGVLVCVGHINRPAMPSYPGQEQFKGQIIHTHTLRSVEPFRNKNAVVVGMGCSGLDATVEISNVAKQTYLSTRSGAHVIHRVGPHGFPFDYNLVRRWTFRLFDIFPMCFVSWLFEAAYTDAQFNQNMYRVKPQYPILSKDPVINDSITSKLHSGIVVQKPDIQKFTEDGIIFEGDTEVTKIDAVIMATGYTWKFPFLEEGTVVQENGRIKLYKCVYPPHLPHGTLAILGFVLPFGPAFPVGELQCRWATQVLAGNCKLPSTKVMLQDIEKRYKDNLKRYAPSEKMSVRIDYVQYCDDVASKFGAKPNLLKIFFTDPKLFMNIYFGPFLSYQFRLQGPHSWDGAREAIMTCKDRVVYPTAKESGKVTEDNIFLKIVKKILRLFFY